MQRCKSAGGRCKGGKVEAGKSAEDGVRRTECVSCEDRAKVQIGRRPVQRWKSGKGEAEAVIHTQKVGAWLCRALLQESARRSLAPTRERSSRERQLGQHAVLPLPEADKDRTWCGPFLKAVATLPMKRARPGGRAQLHEALRALRSGWRG